MNDPAQHHSRPNEDETNRAKAALMAAVACRLIGYYVVASKVELTMLANEKDVAKVNNAMNKASESLVDAIEQLIDDAGAE